MGLTTFQILEVDSDETWEDDLYEFDLGDWEQDNFDIELEVDKWFEQQNDGGDFKAETDVYVRNTETNEIIEVHAETEPTVLYLSRVKPQKENK